MASNLDPKTLRAVLKKWHQYNTRPHSGAWQAFGVWLEDAAAVNALAEAAAPRPVAAQAMEHKPNCQRLCGLAVCTCGSPFHPEQPPSPPPAARDATSPRQDGWLARELNRTRQEVANMLPSAQVRELRAEIARLKAERDALQARVAPLDEAAAAVDRVLSALKAAQTQEPA